MQQQQQHDQSQNGHGHGYSHGRGPRQDNPHLSAHPFIRHCARIVEQRQMQVYRWDVPGKKLSRIRVDLYSASVCLQVWRGLLPENREKLEKIANPVTLMDICYTVTRKVDATRKA